ncbi:endonuclease/exonuclease/phosphatase family protein [Bacillus glycinifermentans]|uniref:endonuclease/exonuclease/phosphatase family protein n=1 Tax=Bacillus glycinifermentans TaxID=1664069 RepID=UPI001FF3BF8D|nr:endonuclease/exonuclease/phosphatase family protein [Bacillus glycinifermentans]UOY89307.1 endonuclease/exonuclease/phosphatase family protein [Bacillus glycinifermentans]
MDISIMTFNIHHGKGTDQRLDLQRIAELIAESGADIIGLNEVDRHFSKRSRYEDQISRLAKELEMEHAYSPSVSLRSKGSQSKRQYGNALLSRFPIVEEQHHLFNFVPGLIEGRSLLETAIDIDGRLLYAFVTHLSLHPSLHRKQTGYIAGRLQKLDKPAIVLGDWNMKPRSRGWKRVTGVLRDAWEAAGDGAGFTYPSRRPKKRLDYIFVSPSLYVTAAEVVTKSPEASDHLPLTAVVTI